MAQIEASLENTAEALSILDVHLAGSEYAVGTALTMGDVTLGPAVYRWLNMEIERLPLPGLEAWHERLQARSAYQANVMAPFTRRGM